MRKTRGKKKKNLFAEMMKTLFGGLTIALCIFLFMSIYTGGNSTPHIENMGVLTDVNITKAQEEKVGKKKHIPFVYAQKDGSTYKVEVPKSVYDDVTKLRESNPDARYDIMYSKEIYGEKTAVGISLSERRY